MILGYTEFFINVEGYTDCDYKGATGEKFSIFGGILIFFSMRVGGAWCPECDMQCGLSVSHALSKKMDF